MAMLLLQPLLTGWRLPAPMASKTTRLHTQLHQIVSPHCLRTPPGQHVVISIGAQAVGGL